MNRILIFISFFVFSLFLHSQQDPQYNLYLFNQYIINPAYGGTKGTLSSIITYRDQWINFPGRPHTFNVSIHTPLEKYKLGYGFVLYNEKIGLRNTSGFSGSTSYFLSINQSYKISFGTRIGLIKQQIMFDKLTLINESETAFTENINYNKILLDIDAGAYLYSNSFYFGFSSTHLNKPKILSYNSSELRNYTYNIHYFIIYGKSFLISDNLALNINCVHKLIANNHLLDVTINSLIKDKLWIGVLLRSNLVVGTYTQILIKDNFKFGYCFEIGTGKIALMGNTHELMIGWDLPRKLKNPIIHPRFM